MTIESFNVISFPEKKKKGRKKYFQPFLICWREQIN